MILTIYGAQAIALGTYKAIHYLYPKQEILCYLVTEIGANETELDGVPVLEIDSLAKTISDERKDEYEVIIATPENVMPEIEESLEYYGFKCHVRMTSLRWASLMEYYLVAQGKYMPLSSLPVGFHKSTSQVYMAKFYKDRALKSEFQIPDWIVPIQVGSALCEERVADILDCENDNISVKNVNYSELTALYWIWKNVLNNTEKRCDTADYYGLVHYRRILNLTDDDMLRLKDNKVDVVLPYPMPYQPSIHAHHERYLSESDWNAVLVALEELSPQYADVFPDILSQQWMFNYNIIVAKTQVLKAYCDWLFPILERVEELSIPKGNARADRYIGYIGEILETLYFMKNYELLNIKHVGCRFLI